MDEENSEKDVISIEDLFRLYKSISLDEESELIKELSNKKDELEKIKKRININSKFSILELNKQKDMLVLIEKIKYYQNKLNDLYAEAKNCFENDNKKLLQFFIDEANDTVSKLKEYKQALKNINNNNL